MTGGGPRDLLTLLEAQAAEATDQLSIITEDGTTLSRADVLDRACSIAYELRKAAGVQAGRPRIGIALPNGTDLALTLLGAMLTGIAIPFNPALGGEDAASALERSRINLLVAKPGMDDLAITCDASRKGIPILRQCSIASVSTMAKRRPPRPEPHDTALVLMTSGSTGSGKQVPLSHQNICVSASDVARSMALGRDDRCLSMWEQHHIGGVVDLLLAPLISGGSVVMTRGFDAGLFFDLVTKVRPTWFQGVPATLAELVLQANRRGHRGGGSLRLIRSVAAALPPSSLSDIEEVFSVPVIQTFGMTEASPLIASTALPPAKRKPVSVGRACGPAIRILGLEGCDMAQGEVGEVAVRGANVFAGYEDDPAANAEAFRDGWFLTGDLGRFDAEGDLFLTGRLKQIINRGGEKVAPDEIDAVLTDHPAIAASAAFAIPHKGLGEDVAAAVVLRTGEALSAEEVRTWVGERLASFKVPGHVVFLDALPRTPVGKVDRPALALLAARSRAQTGDSVTEITVGEGLRDALEAFVAAIWAQELEIPTVGFNDDFAVLGGDSLSALRVQLALEAAFGLRLKDAEVRLLRTVQATAVLLRQHGAVLPASSAASFMGSVTTGSAEASTDLAAAYASLAGCERISEVRARVDTISVKATPAELAALLSSSPTNGLSTARKGSVGARAHVWLWRARTRLQLSLYPRACAWTRQSLIPNLDLYKSAAGDSDRQSRTLIVGFAGNYMRLMLPTWNILVNLDHRLYDLLLLGDPAHKHFAGGVPGLAGDLQALAHSLAAHAKEYGRTMAVGTSAGGLAAIAVAGLNGWDGAVAVGADRPSAHPEIEAILRKSDLGVGRTRLCYGAGQPRDSAAAQEIAAILGDVVLEPYPGFRQHNLLLHLMRRRRLRTTFDRWFVAVSSDPLVSLPSALAARRAGA